MDGNEPGGKAFARDVLRLPVRILAAGFAILIPALIWNYMIGTGVAWSFPSALNPSWAEMFVAMLVFGAGISLVVMLWWLTARFFRLLESRTVDAATMAVIKDMPMGLPDGTVRAILALVVAMVGLPMLVFQGVLNLEPEIAGYINGIVAGVFGFYFGTRTSGVPANAVDRMADAHQTAIRKTEEAADAKVQAANAQGAIEAAETSAARVTSAATEQVQRARDAAGFDDNLSKVERHLALARTIVKDFATALPPGLIPPGTGEMLADAEQTVAALRSVTSATATREQVDQLATITGTLAGSASPLATLLKNAAPLLANVLPLPGLGQLARLVTLLGVGARLGSSQYLRWRARVLAAPVGQRLVEFGTVTPELIHAALQQAPRLAHALAPRDQDKVELELANMIASPDAAGMLLAAFGPQGSIAPDLVPDAAAAQAGIAQLQQALLALYAANDVQPETVQQVADAVAQPALPELAELSSTLRAMAPATLNQLVDSVAGLSADKDLPEDQRAAFDALVSLVDAARRQHIDLLAAIAELR
jgi:hypothetical protein